MPKEAVRKSVLVEPLEHSVVPAANIHHTLKMKMLSWIKKNMNGVGVVLNDARVMFKKQLCIQPKRGPGTNWHLQEVPIKIAQVKVFGGQGWFKMEKEAFGLGEG